MQLSYSEPMKRVVPTIVLVALVIVELYLFTGFLPTRWQVAINDTLRHILPQTYDYSVVTHPAIDQEIEQAMKDHIGLRLIVWAVFTGMLAVNTFLIRWVWHLLRRISHATSKLSA